MNSIVYARRAMLVAGICFSASFSPALAQDDEQPIFPSSPAPAPQPAQVQPVIMPSGPAEPVAAPAEAAPPMIVPTGSGSPATVPPSSTSIPSPVADDPSLSTQEAAVECATAMMVLERRTFSDPRSAAFKAGLCTGKVQSYMLRAQAENPSCFPKISLDEGIGIFVKWADTHLGEGSSAYPEGLRKAFGDAVPCLKK